MEIYNFIKFEGRNLKTENRITITKSNSIGLPSKFYNNNDISNFNYAVLFWDPNEKAIGIKFTNEENESSKFKIIKSQMGGGMIMARSFFKVNNIDTIKYHGRYEFEIQDINEIGKIFIIKIIDKKDEQV